MSEPTTTSQRSALSAVYDRQLVTLHGIAGGEPLRAFTDFDQQAAQSKPRLLGQTVDQIDDRQSADANVKQVRSAF
ncbi:MAG: hypothetical protein H0X39_11330 [Actinobacteria bacterium]|nr:hypothetical protein [Actinomycetota bacterium]